MIPAVTVTNEMKSKGDFLVKLMRGRLKTLLKRRIETEAKRNHWAIQLAFKNFAIVAAYMVVLDHVKSDLTCLDDTMSLLSPNTDRFLLCNTFPQREGAYLYFDTNLGAFVRSGKLQDRALVSGTKSMKRNQKREMQAATSIFVSIRRSSKKIQDANTVYSSHLGNTLLLDLIQTVLLH